MKRAGTWVSAAVVLVSGALAPSVAHAEEATKADFGLRTGYGIPFGKLSGDADEKMNKSIAGQIPLWLDLGARINGRIYVGGYFSYGFGILGGDMADLCDGLKSETTGDVGCSTSDMRLGANVLYHFGPATESHFWAGGGLGYEWWRVSISNKVGSQEASASVTGHGFEFVNLQLGGDFPIAENFALGPFLAFSLAQFGTVSTDCSGDCAGFGGESDSIDHKALHEWLFLGVRGSFQFGGG